MAKGRNATDSALLRVLEAGASEAAGRHSKLYAWLRRNHAHLSAQVEEMGCVPWAAWMDAISREDLPDRSGKKASLRTTQQTWYRLCRAIEAERAKRTAAALSAEGARIFLPAGNIAPGVHRAEPPTPSPPVPEVIGMLPVPSDTPRPARQLRRVTSIPGMPGHVSPAQPSDTKPSRPSTNAWPEPIR